MNIGIVGHEAAKFTPVTEATARRIIREVIAPAHVTVVSGRSPLGGIDIWAEEEAAALGRPTRIFPPKRNTWEGGFKDRNLQIARTSHIVHCLVVTELPDTYKGMRFDFCYHCGTSLHVKSGGCWTARRCAASVWWEITGETARRIPEAR